AAAAPARRAKRRRVARAGARHAEAHGPDGLRLDPFRLEELADHRHEAVVVERDELAGLDHRRPFGRLLEQTEQRFGSPDVGGQQHGSIMWKFGNLGIWKSEMSTFPHFQIPKFSN